MAGDSPGAYSVGSCLVEQTAWMKRRLKAARFGSYT